MDSPVSQPSNIKFEESNKLDKPNVDWVITEALQDVRRARATNNKQWFIYSVDALLEVSAYYWLLDMEFEGKIKALENWHSQELFKFPSGNEFDINGRNIVDLNFELAMKKFHLVMVAIVKSTKKIPMVDEV